MSKFVYVDNSNVWIEGRRVSAVTKDMAYDVWDAINNSIFDREWKYDFGKLLNLVGGMRNGLKKASLFGSRPPENDSLWAAAASHGFEVTVEDRNAQNREKKIDTGIAVQMIADSYEIPVNPRTDEMVLVAGDSDYVPVILNLSKRGIRVVVWFWDHAAPEIKNAAAEFRSLNRHLVDIAR
ncbi:MAG: NYN domain-containing protein [Planctomycetaceae bacterium]|nr:NYN domain-containing protein [Planctomycetaceae bacterium]